MYSLGHQKGPPQKRENDTDTGEITLGDFRLTSAPAGIFYLQSSVEKEIFT